MAKEVKKKAATTKKTTAKKPAAKKTTVKKTAPKKNTTRRTTTSKKTSKKGITLVEILAMLVVLAIILAISVPNITGILSKQKENISVEDANKLVEAAKIRVRTQANVDLPSYSGYCNVYTMAFLDRNDDYTTGTNGGEYDKYESFVIVKKIVKDADGNVVEGPESGYNTDIMVGSIKKALEEAEKGANEVTYEYYVRLYENVDGEAMGVEITNIDEFDKNLKEHMISFNKKVGISAKADMLTIHNGIKDIDEDLCAHIERVYIGDDDDTIIKDQLGCFSGPV